MDTNELAQRTLIILQVLGVPLTLPTVCHLMVDMFNVVDHRARNALQILTSNEDITIDNGGWVRVVRRN